MSELGMFVQEFVVESRENLDQLERDLIALEDNPTARETLGSIFRTIHTIKGAAGFVGLPKLARLAHSGEGILTLLRDGHVVINPELISALLTLGDFIRRMLVDIERDGCEGEADSAPLIALLERLQETYAKPATETAQPDPGERPQGSQAAEGQGTAPIAHGDRHGVPDEDRRNVSRSGPAPANVRVNVEHLDALMNLVSELVLARNEIVQFSAGRNDAALLDTSLRLSAIISQLQEGVMKTRMQPVDTVLNKLPRVARDAAQVCGKRVRLETEGKDTELDRTLIEAIQDPLFHVIRNCVDHGLETPDERVALGKPPEGRISLRAFHESGQVTIEVSDDGRGIDVAMVKQKAIERGLITVERSRVMTDSEATSLIFKPGFSTAATVTRLSGRGVGMDVVKTNVEEIGGRVSVHSQPGVGTTLRMRIPLTLAIMQALIVSSGAESYAIPLVNVVELTRLDAADSGGRIEQLHDATVYRLRGELLPLISLGQELRTVGRAPTAAPTTSPATGPTTIVVLQADTRRFALAVDQVKDLQEIVIKPLGPHVRSIPLFAGATIVSDRRVVLILDIPGLAVRSRVLTDEREHAIVGPDVIPTDPTNTPDALLLVAGPEDSRMAIPILQITRLEAFPCSAIEQVGDRRVVQYFGEALPLEPLTSLLGAGGRSSPGGAAMPGNGHLQTLVYSNDGRRLGIVVDRILDTIEPRLEDLRPSTRDGVIGSLVIQGRITEIVDLRSVCGDGV